MMQFNSQGNAANWLNTPDNVEGFSFGTLEYATDPKFVHELAASNSDKVVPKRDERVAVTEHHPAQPVEQSYESNYNHNWYAPQPPYDTFGC